MWDARVLILKIILSYFNLKSFFFRYMAPEIFSSKGYTEKVDIFSLGIIVYTMINGSHPFKGNDLKSLVKNTC